MNGDEFMANQNLSHSGEFDDILPIEERIKGMEPPCDGLYPHEVLALSYVHKYTISSTAFEGFWFYRYGISDMQALIASLCERGYVAIGNLEQTIQKSTMSYMKSILKEHGLKVSGKKSELIQRLLDNIGADALEKLFPDKPYFLTPLGQHILEQYAYIHYIHIYHFDDLDIWSLNQLMSETPDKPFQQVIWQHLCHKYESARSQKSYGLARNCKCHMAELAATESSYDTCLSALYEVVYYDLSGLDNLYDGTGGHLNFHMLSSFYNSQSLIADGIISRIRTCTDNLSLTDSEIRAQMTAVLSNIDLPAQFFTLEECVDILIFALHNDYDSISPIYKTAEDRYRLNYPNEYADVMRQSAESDSVRTKLIHKAKESNRIYDPEFEKEIEERLSKLDELSRNEFYRIRFARKHNGTLSDKKLDLLTLEAMERSYNYRNNQG